MIAKSRWFRPMGGSARQKAFDRKDRQEHPPRTLRSTYVTSSRSSWILVCELCGQKPFAETSFNYRGISSFPRVRLYSRRARNPTGDCSVLKIIRELLPGHRRRRHQNYVRSGG